MKMQQLKTSQSNIHYKSYSTGHFLMPKIMSRTRPKLFPYKRQEIASRHRRLHA